jgi:DNA polymerase (family X)
LSVDWPRVFAEAGELDKALEIDCYPDRQDLNVGLLKVAREHGTRISIGTDAHHPWQLQFIELGLAAALKAKISSHRIINFMSISDLRNWVKQTRQLKNNAIVGVWLTYVRLSLTTEGEFVFDYTV